ncbi:hypothetical protein F4861DRAFT_506809 [Xylaria intraflava]|nr:hypothetical protein F4861DRAFT_506809 [Xylaria intraflava]
MADARALLRAHRAENRIKHSLAAYSDAGKLFCRLCQDLIRSESLWDAHIRSQPHKQRLSAQHQQQIPPAQASDESAHKRKRSDDVDEPMSDTDQDPGAIRTKRSKTSTVTDGLASGIEGGIDKDRDRDKDKQKEKTTQTPPGKPRRASGTPVQGVEIAIPSRPATPLPNSGSTVSTPRVASIGRSPLVGADIGSILGASASALSQQQPLTAMSISDDNVNVPARNTIDAPSISNSTTAQRVVPGAVDETEWAAFEAEMSALDAAAPLPTVPPASDSRRPFADATISAPAMTTAQVAAKSQEEENERLKQAAEAKMADEREDATRALETEFEEMEELESRVRRLKERREQLRRESVMNLQGPAALKTHAKDPIEKENLLSIAGNDMDKDDDDGDDEDEDEDEDEDDWDGFRFRP